AVTPAAASGPLRPSARSSSGYNSLIFLLDSARRRGEDTTVRGAVVAGGKTASGCTPPVSFCFLGMNAGAGTRPTPLAVADEPPRRVGPERPVPRGRLLLSL